MVYIGGPRGRRRGIFLHDPPPGYQPDRPKVPLKARQRRAREDYVLMRVLTVVLILSAVAFLAIICVFIAMHS